MKKINYFLSLAMIAALSATFTACSSDEEASEQQQANNRLTLTSSVQLTRSTNTELQNVQIASGNHAGAFVVDGSTTAVNNNDLTADGSGNFTGNAMTWPSSGSASIYAYAPYNSSWGVNTANSFSVSADQSSDANYLASDLLYGVPTATNPVSQTSDGNVAMSFSHKLAKIVVTVNNTNQDVTLGGSSVNILNTLPTTSLNPTNGALGTASGTATSIKAATFATSATEFKAAAVIVPQTVAANTDFVVIYTSDKAYTAKLGSATTFESGKLYKYTVSIGSGSVETSLTLNGGDVSDWQEGQSSEIGATEGELPELTYSPTSFGTPTSNATYENGTFTWTATNNNLMTILEFSNGELANYKTLEVTTSNLTSGSWRLLYVLEDGTTDKFATTNASGEATTSTYYSAGAKTIDLSAQTIDLSKVKQVRIAGNSLGTGETSSSLDIAPSDVVLKGTASSSSTGDSGNTSDGNTLTATFGTPASNATYDATTSTYTWTGSTSNLMTIFTFANGELANYKTLEVTTSDLSSGSWRLMYVLEDGTSGRLTTTNSSGETTSATYYSAGKKTVDLTIQTIDLSKVTSLSFGGSSNEGSIVIKASDVILSK